ncbi:MAG: hypothetical protein AAGA54_23160 [Myxococcota bacterium]
MPSVEDEVLPAFDPDAFTAVAIHSFAEGRFPATHTQIFGLTFPVALDYDSEQFRRFRLPAHVFPLNVVFDEQGAVAHVGTELEDAVAVVETLLGG